MPAGTRNHFALDLGLDREDVVGALDAFGEASERTIDLATVNGRVFVNNASLGLYAEIVQSPEYRDAKIRTASEMLPDLLGPDAEPLDLRYTGPDGEAHTTAHMVLVSNNPVSARRSVGHRNPRAHRLGELGVVTAQIEGALAAEQFVALNAAGQIRRFPGWREWTAARFRIDSGAPGADRRRRRGHEPRPAAGVRERAGCAPRPATSPRPRRFPGGSPHLSVDGQ